MKKTIKILAIETSCDETAAAVIGATDCHSGFISESHRNNGSRNKFGMTGLRPVILSSIVSSQADLHAKTGGIVPEVASRAHMEAIVPIVTEALNSALQIISNSLPADDPHQALQAGEFLISNQFINPNDSNINNSDLNKNLKLTTKNYRDSISFLQSEISHIAYTAGPGLEGSLLVGYNAAKTMAYALKKPIIPVNHIEGHIYSAFAEQFPISNFQFLNKSQNLNSKTINKKQLGTEPKFPILALTVSGGHTSLTLMSDHGKYQNIGHTIDDAAGEAFDKVAKLLGLGYPGGPIVSKYAAQFRNNSGQSSVASRERLTKDSGPKTKDLQGIVFPRPIINDGTFNFSFSGLKTAVLQKVTDIKFEKFMSCHPELVSGSRNKFGMTELLRRDFAKEEISEKDKQEICAAFEDAVVDVLTTKAVRAVEKYQPKTIILAGGVAANKRLRETLEYKVSSIKYQDSLKPHLFVPPLSLCGDNAAMIGLAAYYHVLKNNVSTWDKSGMDSNLELK